MRRSLLASTALFSLAVSFVAASQTPQPAPAAPAVPSRITKSCTITHSSPSDADALLASQKYPEAEQAFRAQLTQDAASLDTRLGIIRSLIGEDKTSDAQAQADAMLLLAPQNALSEVAVAEAAYRAADLPASMAHARAALRLDACEGRAHSILADLYAIDGFSATAARDYKSAHLLRPDDELITRDWIDSLPRKIRQIELDKYLAGKTSLSVNDTRGYDNELQHLKARRPNECHVGSKTDAVTAPMQPVFGDNPQPVAYGLDVSFNGKRRRVQIDTGASGIVITQEAARGLGLQPEYKIKTGGVGDEGELDSYLTHVASIRIGDVEISDCMVEVVQKSKLDVDGLIGMDVFSHWMVTLDYQNAQMRLAPLPARPGGAVAGKLDSDPLPGDIGDEDATPHDRYVAPEMKDWLPFIRLGHQIMLPAHSNTGPTHWVIMDTGASDSSLSLDFGKEAGKLSLSETQFIGLSGKVNKVYETKYLPLVVGTVQLAPASYYAYDLTKISHSTGFETSGLFGLPTLQRLTIQIDYRDNLVKLTYDPGHDRQRF